MKDKLLLTLEIHYESLKLLKSELNSLGSTHVSRDSTQHKMREICRLWFGDIKNALNQIDNEIIGEYSKNFKQLLIYSRKSSVKRSVLNLLDEIMKDYQEELINTLEVSDFNSTLGIDIIPYLEDLEEDEKKYLEEAAKCANNNCLRASVILGWCAMIDHIHKKIFAEGLSNFNLATKEMKSRSYGRFKRFNKQYSIESLSELREVFDTDLMWVLEYIQYIDKNQHERLRYCFTLRNNAAHPGEATIKPENLYSFYSDISEIVLKNDKLKIA